MKKKINSQTVEDYLKTVYLLEEKFGRAKTSLLAEQLGITPGSVTDMVKRMSMADPPLIDYRHHHGVRLTAAGKKNALQVIRRHRLLETFMHKILGFGWDEVHQEAEELEHHLSERVTDAIDRLLEFPRTDPHGEVIPSRNGRVASVTQMCLSEVDPGRAVRVVWVSPRQDEMLHYLGTLGIGVDTRLCVEQKAPFNGPLTLHIEKAGKKRVHTVGREITDHIYVEILDEPF